MKEITFEETKELFKQAIDETDTIFEAFGRTIQLVYQTGYADGRASIVEELEKLKAEIREWYWQADKQKLSEDACVVDAMTDLFIRTVDKRISELKGENNEL